MEDLLPIDFNEFQVEEMDITETYQVIMVLFISSPF